MPTGPKGQKRPADVIGAAVRVIRIATGEGRRRLGRANGGYSYLARSPAHPAERFPIIPDSRTHNLPPGIQSRERGGSVRGSLFRTGDRGRAPRRCRCVSRFRLVLLGTGFLLETSRKPLKPIRERAKLIGAAQIVP